MKKAITLLSICAACAFAGAQSWTTYHGNAARTGYTSVIGPNTFSLSWATSVGAPVVSSPVVGPDGTIYIGPLPEESLRPKTVITALAVDGGIKWQFRTPFVENDLPTFSTPAVGSDGTVYFGSTDGSFYALNPDGTVKWRHGSPRPIVQTPVIGPSGDIYVGIDGQLTAFTPTGSVRWQVPMGSPRLSGGPSVGADGTIYAAKGEDNVGSTLVAVSPSGVVLWQTFLNPYFWPLAPPTVGPDGTIYTAAQGIHAINPNGSQKWYSEPSYGINGYGSIAVDPQNNLYYSGYVYAWKLSGATGNVIWQYLHTANNSTLGHCVNGILVDGAGKLYMGLGDGKRSAIDYEKQFLLLSNGGTRMAGFAVPEIAGASSPALIGDGSLFIGSLDGKVYAFNVPPARFAPPSAANTEFGTIVGGNAASLAQVDGDMLRANGAVNGSRTSPVVSVITEGSVSEPNATMVKLEVNATINQSTAELKAEMYNWSSSQWEAVASKPISPSTVELAYYVTGSTSRFIQAGTNAVRARLSVVSPALNSARGFQLAIDRAVWKTIQ